MNPKEAAGLLRAIADRLDRALDAPVTGEWSFEEDYARLRRFLVIRLRVDADADPVVCQDVARLLHEHARPR